MENYKKFQFFLLVFILCLFTLASNNNQKRIKNFIANISDEMATSDLENLSEDASSLESSNNLFEDSSESTSVENTSTEGTDSEGSTSEESTGEESTGEESTGEESTNEESAGEESTGEESTGEESTGEESTGEESTNEESTNEVISSEEQLSLDLAVNEAVVKTFAELKTAISEDNGIDTVYLANDIVMEIGGIVVNAYKTKLTVDGINPYDSEQVGPHIIRDFNSTAFASTINVNGYNVNLRELNIKNLEMFGKNYYGTFSVYDGVANKDLVINYENIKYTGPQLVHNRQGRSTFKDIDVHIHGNNSTAVSSEFAESKHVSFLGDNKILIDSTAYPIFWHPAGGSFRVEDNSNLSIISPNSSKTYGMFFSDTTAYKILVSVGKSANFDVELHAGFAPTGTSISNLLLEENSNFNLNFTAFEGGILLLVYDSFILRDGAKFDCKTMGSNNCALELRNSKLILENNNFFKISSTANHTSIIDLFASSISVKNPDYFYISNNSNRLITTISGTSNIHFDAPQINYWDSYNNGGFANMPKNHLAKDYSENLNIDMLLTIGVSGDSSNINTNFVEGDIGEKPSTANFSWRTMRMLSCGKMKLHLDSFSKTISGNTEANSDIRISENNIALLDEKSNSEGYFNFQSPKESNKNLVLFAYNNYLYRKYITEGELTFIVPAILNFKNTKLASENHDIERADENWQIEIIDSRKIKTAFSLHAKIKTPFNSKNQHDMNANNLIFVDENNEKLFLTEFTEVLIYQNDINTEEQILLKWPINQGILNQVNAGLAFSDFKYTAELDWILTIGP